MKLAITFVLAGCLAFAGCGKKDDKGGDKDETGDKKKAGGDTKKAGGDDKKEAGGDKKAGGGDTKWHAGDQKSFKAAYSSNGEATRDTEITGTFYVGPKAVRLDMDKHPNAGGPMSFIRVHGEKDLWTINPGDKSYGRALSGNWEHDVIPRVLDDGDVEDIAEGECPFGSGKPDECKQTGTEEVAGRAVAAWTYKSKKFWVDPELRTALKSEYTPFRNNPKTQVTTLSDVQVGDQDAALFTVPADFECTARAFCDDAPK